MGPSMTYRGRIKHGRITLDEPAQLPEGAAVNVEVVEATSLKTQQRRPRVPRFQPIEMPGGVAGG